MPFEQLADPLVRRSEAPDGPVIEARSDCAAVVIGKLSSQKVAKARAYLARDGSTFSVKAWWGDDQLAVQERRIREAWQHIPDFPAPPMLHAGTVDDDRSTSAADSRVHYVVEPLVLGRHPFSVEARVAAATDLLPSLARSWRAYGPVDRTVSDAFDTRLLRRLWPVLGDPAVRRELESLSRFRLYRRLWWLVRRNRTLPFAPGHGDMVSTNIIREPDGRHLLVDWEHGREMPIAFDVAKLLLTSGQPLEVNRRLADTLAVFGAGPDRYRWNEQLALGVCRLLTWSSDRRDRAHAAGRGRQFDIERVAQVRLLVELLDEPTP